MQKQVIELRKSLRSVQSVLSRDVLALQTTVMVLNIAAVPVLLIIAALFVAWRRRARRARFVKEEK